MSVPISKVLWVSTSEILGRTWTWPTSTPHNFNFSVTEGSKGQPLPGLRNTLKCHITCTLYVIFLSEKPPKKAPSENPQVYLQCLAGILCPWPVKKAFITDGRIWDFFLSDWRMILLSLLLKLPALFQLPMTSFVFPLTLTRFSVDLTL